MMRAILYAVLLASSCGLAGEDSLASAALVGRWGNSGVKYGFTDDGLFYRSTTLSHMRSIYHMGTTTYSGDYVYTTSGWWENQFSTTYLNTLFGRYRVADGVIRFMDVVSIAHSSFGPGWHRAATRTAEEGGLPEKFGNADFARDFTAEYEFITPARLRLRETGTDRDFFWDWDDVAHDAPVPGRRIPPVAWPAADFPPGFPALATRGRLREASVSAGEKATGPSRTATLIIDRTEALADLRSFVREMRQAGWWCQDPPDGDQEYWTLEARKGLWRITIKNGTGQSKTYADSVTIEAALFPEGAWPAAWGEAGLPPPAAAVLVGNTEYNPDGPDADYRGILYMDGVGDQGVSRYAELLRMAGFAEPADSEGGWPLYRYIRIGGAWQRVQIKPEGRHGGISSFEVVFRHMDEGAWPEAWSGGGLPAPKGQEAILGVIGLDRWKEEAAGHGSFYQSIKFLGLDAQMIGRYQEDLLAAGFTREDNAYKDSPALYGYLRLDGTLCRVEVEQRKNDELTEFTVQFRFFEDGAWPEAWKALGIPEPRHSAIVGAFEEGRFNNRAEWFGSFHARMKLLDADLAEYAAQLRQSGFADSEYPGGSWELGKQVRLDGKAYRLTISDARGGELPEVTYHFREE